MVPVWVDWDRVRKGCPIEHMIRSCVANLHEPIETSEKRGDVSNNRLALLFHNTLWPIREARKQAKRRDSNHRSLFRRTLAINITLTCDLV